MSASDFLEFVQKLKQNKPNIKVLDVGCGGGRHSIQLAKMGFEVYGIDFSEYAIRVAKENAQKENVIENIYFRVGNVLELSFEENFFDIIIIAHSSR